MSFTRFAWAREYTKGDSNLYAYWDSESDKIAIISTYGDEITTLIDREDFFELIVSVLSCAGVKLSRKQLKKLADYLKVELRKKPLTLEEMIEDMEKKCRKRKR